MKIVHVLDCASAGVGGPAGSVASLVDSLCDPGTEVRLVANHRAWLGECVSLSQGRAIIVEKGRTAERLQGYSREFADAVRSQAAWADVIHSHGLWMYANYAAREAARVLDKPLVVSPRGMLEPWSLAFRGWKKILAWRFVERRNLLSARVLHATSASELNAIRRAGLRNPVAVIPNAVRLPGGQALPREVLEERVPPLHGRRVALFLSRIHPKKGVLELVRAWKDAAPDTGEWVLVMAGGGEASFLEIVRETLRSLNLEGDAVLTGPLYGAEKGAVLAHAELFLLPSFSENFGNAVAEALLSEIPVIVTPETTWSRVADLKCGWVATRREFAGAIRSACALDSSSLTAMGQRGAAWCREFLDAETLAQSWRSVYAWLVGRSEMRPPVIDVPGEPAEVPWN